MAQTAKKSRTPSLILGFRGVKLSLKFGDSYFFLDFETSYIPLVNGFLIYGYWYFMFIVYIILRNNYTRDR